MSTKDGVGLSDNYKNLLHEFYEIISHKHGENLAKPYIRGCADFLLFISERGCNDPAKLTIDHLLEYCSRIRELQLAPVTKKHYVSGVNSLLKYFYKQGYVPRCYSSVIFSEKESNLDDMRLPNDDYPGEAFQPSKELDSKADEFLLKLDGRFYSKASQRNQVSALDVFFKFLEINHLAYTSGVSSIWLRHNYNGPSWKLRRQIITMFDEYMETGEINDRKVKIWKPLYIESLPEWSRNIIDEYLILRRREGWERNTITTNRAACVRFFGFLEQKGIVCPNEITPAIVKEFHNNDSHSTPAGRNAYSSSIRKLLIYMSEMSLVPSNLYLAISTQCAPRRKIASIMSPETEAAIFDYRQNAEHPMELRNTAIVMIGLRMGLRSSDIVNLKMDDIDWKKHTLTIIQTKTKRAISLPLPTEVGNSIYKYIKHGRPQSGTLGAGYIFITHRAPYSGLNHVICKKALDDILLAYGIKLQSGQGFHITRRTFATQLLTARTSVDIIADSLGHVTRYTVDGYLAHDEEGMRLCPLPFTIGGAH